MNLISDRGVSWPGDYEDAVLVLEPRNSGNVGYYLVDHSKQVVFWPEEFQDVVWDTKEVKVELNSSHVGKHLENTNVFCACLVGFRPLSSILLLVILLNLNHCFVLMDWI